MFALLPLLLWQVEDGIYRVSTNVPPLACYNLGFGLHQPILLILGRNVTEIASNQTMVYFLTHLTNASVLPGKMWKCENRIFWFWYCITALPELNQSLLDFISLHNLLYNFLILPTTPHEWRSCDQVIIMAALCNSLDHHIFILSYVLLLSSFFFFLA